MFLMNKGMKNQKNMFTNFGHFILFLNRSSWNVHTKGKVETETLFIYVTFFSSGQSFPIKCNFYFHTITLGTLMILQQKI